MIVFELTSKQKCIKRCK